MSISRRHFLITSTSAAVAACGALSTSQQSPQLLISAAASLQDVMQEVRPLVLAQLTEMGYQHVSLSFNFGGSGTLQRQIEQGAPSDVFVPAAAAHIEALESAQLLLDNSWQPLLRNRIVLIIPASRPEAVSISGFSELTDRRVQSVAIAQPNTAPAGQYAKEVLTHLNSFEPLRPKLLFGKDVRQVLTYVETGNVDAGLVYVSDAKGSANVRAVDIADESWHSPIRYPAAAIATSRHPELARAIVSILASPAAASIYQSYGFQAV